MKALLKVNFKELIRKEYIWQELLCRHDAEAIIGNVSNTQYLSFLKNRLQSIVNQIFYSLPFFYTYVRVYGDWHIGCKSFVKDLLSICFLNHSKEFYENNKYV